MELTAVSWDVNPGIGGFPESAGNTMAQAMAWVIKRRTVMTDAWIIEALHMGSRPMIHRAVKRFDQASEKLIKQLKRRLLDDLSI